MPLTHFSYCTLVIYPTHEQHHQTRVSLTTRDCASNPVPSPSPHLCMTFAWPHPLSYPSPCIPMSAIHYTPYHIFSLYSTYPSYSSKTLTPIPTISLFIPVLLTNSFSIPISYPYTYTVLILIPYLPQYPLNSFDSPVHQPHAYHSF